MSGVFSTSSTTQIKQEPIDDDEVVRVKQEQIDEEEAVVKADSQSASTSTRTGGARWTAQEDELIQGLRSGKYTKDEVARRLPHRTAKAIHSRKQALKPRVAGSKKKTMTNWSAEEDRLINGLREGRLSIGDVARQLPHRTKSAIESRRWTRRKATSTSGRAVRFWTPQEDAALANGLPDDPAALSELMRRLPGRTVNSVEHRLRQLKRGARASGIVVGPAPKKRKGVFWTPQEDALLAGGIPNDPDALEALMRQLPGRSVQGVRDRLERRHKAARTDLTTATTKGTRRKQARRQPWTAAEDELVAGMCSGLYTKAELLERLPHRNKGTIDARVVILRKAGVVSKDSVRCKCGSTVAVKAFKTHCAHCRVWRGTATDDDDGDDDDDDTDSSDTDSSDDDSSDDTDDSSDEDSSDDDTDDSSDDSDDSSSDDSDDSDDSSDSDSEEDDSDAIIIVKKEPAN